LDGNEKLGLSQLAVAILSSNDSGKQTQYSRGRAGCCPGLVVMEGDQEAAALTFTCGTLTLAAYHYQKSERVAPWLWKTGEKRIFQATAPRSDSQ
jgi:hypothetical protein